VNLPAVRQHRPRRRLRSDSGSGRAGHDRPEVRL